MTFDTYFQLQLLLGGVLLSVAGGVWLAIWLDWRIRRWRAARAVRRLMREERERIRQRTRARPRTF